MSQALDNLRSAMANQKRGTTKRLPNGAWLRAHVELVPADVIAVAEMIADPSQKVKELRQGCINAGNAPTVVLQVDCAFQLLDEATAAAPQH